MPHTSIKFDMEDGVIVLFSVFISGLTKIGIEHVLKTVWSRNRLQGRFYYNIVARYEKFVVEVVVFNKKQMLSKALCVSQIKKYLPAKIGKIVVL